MNPVTYPAGIALALGLTAGGYWSSRKVVGFLLKRRRDLRLLQRQREIMGGFAQDLGEALEQGGEANADQIISRVLACAQHAVRGGGALMLLCGEDEILQARSVAGIFPPLEQDINEATFAQTPGKVQFLRDNALSLAVPLGEGLIGEIGFHGQSVLITAGEADPRLPQYENEFLQIRSLIAVPMRFRNREIGVLLVVNPIDGSPFRAADVELLQLLADEASLSIHYARTRESIEEKRRMDQEFKVAERIQNSLLPRSFPEMDVLEAATFSQAAQQVGGDYVDVIKVDEDHLGLAIADVSGKGIGGAIMMSICRTILRAHAPGNPHPAPVLCEVNRMMTEDMSEDMFVTMIYMVLNVRTLQLRVSRAGHEPVLLWRAGEKCTLLEPGGLAVGMADTKTFEGLIKEQSVDLSPGDLLMVYTDGVTESMNENGEEWGREKFIETVANRRLEPLEKMMDNIKEEILSFAGQMAQYDDMTVLGLRMKSPGDARSSTL